MLRLAVVWHGLHTPCLDSIAAPIGRLPSPGNIVAWSGGRLLRERHGGKDQNHEAIQHLRNSLHVGGSRKYTPNVGISRLSAPSRPRFCSKLEAKWQNPGEAS